jgi:iron complex outermembrane recepter protein
MSAKNATRNRWRTAVPCCGLALFSAPWASAQDAPNKPDVLEEVVVSGIRASLREALEVKMNSDLVVDAISSEDIGQLPDVTIAESINRLPGINATRDRGNDSQAVVRGLGARLVLGTINGREVASSEPDRNVRWEIYPSEVVSGVQVYKTQSADLIAGGVAGTINISTIQPLDYNGPAFVVRGGPVYYESGADIPNYEPWGYRGSASFVHDSNDKFGIVLGVTTQQQKNGYPSFTGWGYNDSTMRPPQGASDFTGDLNGDGSPDATPWGSQISVSRIDQKRTGFSLGTQWRPNDRFELKLDGLYSDIDIHEAQDQTVYGWNNWGNWDNGNWSAYNDPNANYTIVDGSVVAATLPFSSVTTVLADYNEDKKLSATGLNAAWRGDAWTVVGDLSYSKAERENIWQAVRTEVYPTSMTFDTRSGTVPTISTSEDPTTLPQFAPDYRGGSSDGPEHLNDELTAGALDFARRFDNSRLSAIRFGARVSGRTKDHDRFQWFPAAPAGGVEIPASLFERYTIGSVSLPPLLTGDFAAIAAAAYGPEAFNPSNAAEDMIQRWNVDEDVNEGYVRLDFGGGDSDLRLAGNIGVRAIDVKTTSEGFQQATGGSALAPVSTEHDYNAVLPSAGLKLNLAEDKLLRLGIARVIARPPLDELRASRTLSNFSPFTGSAGNPNLDPFKANQLDASYEWYFHPEALAAVAVYYKDVKSYIGWEQSPEEFGGTTYAISSPVNRGGGSIKGFELIFQTPFYFIPHFEHFGLYSNYAYVDSSLKEAAPITDPLPGVGLAQHTATVDLWYNRGPVELRLGYKYHSPFTVIYGWNGADLQSLLAESVLDFSSSYKLTDAVDVRFQVNNLTDEPLRMYRDGDPDRIGRYDLYGRRYLLDVTFKF